MNAPSDGVIGWRRQRWIDHIAVQYSRSGPKVARRPRCDFEKTVLSNFKCSPVRFARFARGCGSAVMVLSPAFGSTAVDVKKTFAAAWRAVA